MQAVTTLIAFAAVAVSGKSLTAANIESEMAGKAAFIKFQAPWWGHCKSMKPAWEQLGGEFENSKTVLIGNVDCTVEKDLCSKYGVRGYPTIKYFTGSTAADGDKYEGGRTFDDLKKFADENLGPSCDAAHKDLCSEEALKELEVAMALSEEDRAAQIKAADEAIAAAEETFKSEVSKLQAKYEQLQKDKEETVSKASAPLKMLRAASVKAEPDAKEEL